LIVLEGAEISGFRHHEKGFPHLRWGRYKPDIPKEHFGDLHPKEGDCFSPKVLIRI